MISQENCTKLQLSFMVNMDVELLAPGTLPVYELKAKRFRDNRPPITDTGEVSTRRRKATARV